MINPIQSQTVMICGKIVKINSYLDIKRQNVKEIEIVRVIEPDLFIY